MRSTHPADHVLRAYLDGELDWPRATSCTLHLRRCSACANALEELRGLDQRTATLLARADSSLWAESARGRARRRRAVRWPVGLGAVAVAAVTVLYVARPTARGATARDGVSDVCCWDLDGGGRGDDGIFTRSRDGQIVECAIVYDDVDHSRSLTPADVVRSMPTDGGCDVADVEPRPSGRNTTS